MEPIHWAVLHSTRLILQATVFILITYSKRNCYLHGVFCSIFLDYDAPLSEAGDYTIKYQLTKDLIAANNDVETKIPAQPEESVKTAYPSVAVTDFLSYAKFIQQIVTKLFFPMLINYISKFSCLFSLQMW